MHATRLVVISDLHLCASASPMMSHPVELAAFIRELPSLRRPDESLELVIDGDFVDFLAIEPFAAFTPDPIQAVAKLQAVFRGPNAPVFDALASHLAADHRLTVVLGNHDLELGLPQVQWALQERLGSRAIHFVDDGQAHRVGRVLIEHGHRYDLANRTDEYSLRALRSALSRNESSAETPLTPSAGSELVCRVLNPLKHQRGYSFLDLLQPQGMLLFYLLLALEPKQVSYIPAMIRAFQADRKQRANPRGDPPRSPRELGGPQEPPHPQEQPWQDEALKNAFPELRPLYSASTRDLGSRSGIPSPDLVPRKDDLRSLILHDEPIPTARLTQLRETFRQLLRQDRALSWSGPTEQYGAAAERMTRHSSIELVVMGHTHQPRREPQEGRPRYLNTGTWIDVILPPHDLLRGGQPAIDAMDSWLRDLVKDQRVRSFKPTWAEIRVAPRGHVEEAELRAGSGDSLSRGAR